MFFWFPEIIFEKIRNKDCKKKKFLCKKNRKKIFEKKMKKEKTWKETLQKKSFEK